MNKQMKLEHILSNQLPVPTKLLTDFHLLGLDEIELVVIIQLHRFRHEGNNFPTPQDLSECLSINETECANILRRLIQKQLLSIDQIENEMNQISEVYSLEPLWEKLFHENNLQQEVSDDGTLFILFEQEFGRPLSPFEIEMINTWLDDDRISPSLIKAGLRESVLMNKLNFKYIDRILRSWKKKGIETVEQARVESRSFKKQASQDTTYKNVEQKDDTLYFNWLTGEDGHAK